MSKNSLNKKVATSNLKKAAAMSAALAAIPAADAAIQYSGALNIVLSGGASPNSQVEYELDFNGDAQVDARIFQANLNAGQSHFAQINIANPGLPANNGVHEVDIGGSNFQIKQMMMGEVINSGLFFDNGSNYLRVSHTGGQYGVFSGIGIAGLRFENAMSTSLYGWVKLDVANDGSSITILGHAYEDSGNSIVAGAIPEPSQVATGLGLLALGAAGIRESRRRKQEKVS